MDGKKGGLRGERWMDKKGIQLYISILYFLLLFVYSHALIDGPTSSLEIIASTNVPNLYGSPICFLQRPSSHSHSVTLHYSTMLCLNRSENKEE